MVTMTDSKQGVRLRAAVDRLHAAQLAALEEAAALADGPGARRDAYGAERQVLVHLAEVGSLLVRLGGAPQVDAESAAIRRRVVTLAVACANTLAELVSLAFEVEGAGGGLGETSEARAQDASQGRELVAPTVPAGEKTIGESRGSKGASPPASGITSMRAVTDTNRLLVDQLKRLMQHAAKRESWRRARPGELWRGLLLQAADLLPLVAELEVGAPSKADEKELARLLADAANYVAFLRFYPRLPTA
jgi:hypothetical protein